jgi:hypothetical protein
MNKMSVFALSWAAVFLLSGSGASGEHRSGACVTCHTFLGGELGRPVAEWNGSIRQQNRITCDLCHGGDASVSVASGMRQRGEQGCAAHVMKGYGAGFPYNSAVPLTCRGRGIPACYSQLPGSSFVGAESHSLDGIDPSEA